MEFLLAVVSCRGETLCVWNVHNVSSTSIADFDFLTENLDSWVARDVTKNQTKKLSILLSFYFHEVLQYLNTFT